RRKLAAINEGAHHIVTVEGGYMLSDTPVKRAEKGLHTRSSYYSDSETEDTAALAEKIDRECRSWLSSQESPVTVGPLSLDIPSGKLSNSFNKSAAQLEPRLAVLFVLVARRMRQTRQDKSLGREYGVSGHVLAVFG